MMLRNLDWFSHMCSMANNKLLRIADMGMMLAYDVEAATREMEL
jgi:hypothetical protein